MELEERVMTESHGLIRSSVTRRPASRIQHTGLAALVGRRREVVRQVAGTRRRVREVWADPLLRKGNFYRK